MRSGPGALIWLTFFGSLVETESNSIRRHRNSRCKWTNSRTLLEQQPDVDQAKDHEKVIWSADGMVGNKYIESNGKHFIEVQELVPAPGGYQIVKKVIETTPPSPVLLAPALPIDPVTKSVDNNIGVWYEPPGQRSYPKLLFSPLHGWREMNAEEARRLDGILPMAEYDSLAHAVKKGSNRASTHHSKDFQEKKQPTEDQQRFRNTYYKSPHPESTLPNQHSIPSRHRIGILNDSIIEQNDGKWIFYDRSWYQHKNQLSILGEENSGPRRSHNIASISGDEPRHQESNLQYEKSTQQLRNNETNNKSLVKVGKLSRMRNEQPHLENVVKIEQEKYRNNEENKTTYSNLNDIYQSHQDQDFGTKIKNVEKFIATEGSGMERGQIPHVRPKLDDIHRRQPKKIQLSDLAQCGHTVTTSENRNFWLLQTEPCGGESAEGRILLPDGKVLKFYGNPQLVKV